MLHLKVAENAAIIAANDIKQAFRNAYFKDGQWVEIEIGICVSVSEGGMTLDDARKMKRWSGF